MQTSLLPDVIQFIATKYGGEAEHPWLRAPAYIVFRHKDNKRIYAIAATVPMTKLGWKDESPVDVLTLKLGDPLLKDLLLEQEGIFPGLGFGELAWITIILDGTVALEDIKFYIDRSFRLTTSAKTRKVYSLSTMDGVHKTIT